MSQSDNYQSPPSRGAGIFRAIVLVAVGVKMLALVADTSAVVALVAAAALVCSVIYLICTILSAIK